jgi:hypothetical protein
LDGATELSPVDWAGAIAGDPAGFIAGFIVEYWLAG